MIYEITLAVIALVLLVIIYFVGKEIVDTMKETSTVMVTIEQAELDDVLVETPKAKNKKTKKKRK